MYAYCQGYEYQNAQPSNIHFNFRLMEKYIAKIRKTFFKPDIYG